MNIEKQAVKASIPRQVFPDWPELLHGVSRPNQRLFTGCMVKKGQESHGPKSVSLMRILHQRMRVARVGVEVDAIRGPS